MINKVNKELDEIRFTVMPADFEPQPDFRNAIEVAMLRQHAWIADVFAGMVAIDVLSTSGTVARFEPTVQAWAVLRKSDRGERPEKSFDVILPGGRIVRKCQ